MTVISQLIDALAAEFSGEVMFYSAPPASMSAPGVAVIPGDPYMEPDTQGLVLVRLDVWVSASLKAPERGADQMLILGLRVAGVAQSVGVFWRNASGPRRPLDIQAQEVISINRLEMKVDPRTVTGD